ncbi:DUF1127 domain-containing protein [Phyllobacterium meliloti]|uniref:DUF1127 domain-containing protein n=1 Tax=Phyllobacterium meliloti TaxID=555317 RepID=UPI001D157E16|nr:DUF1127 domain-containing protein [Phyllobacterium sp. T1293]UGX86964.1 DUF1127 domain-containing protein [Phyllobacterium sp. T1293]
MSTIDAIERKCASSRGVKAVFLPKLPHDRVTILRRIVAWMSKAAVKRRTRIELRELTKDQLKDIGMTPSQAWHESKRFFWD